uniref:Small ribosomal subunit protein eS4 central region domain-containing protein n=1 Tax=Megaselia scalaris TaxID=36166 RepID=T1GNX4_MEGSC
MDVVTIEHFRLVYDVKGRFTIHRISPKKLSTSCAKSARSNSATREYHPPSPTDAPFFTQNLLSRPTTPYNGT